MYTFAIKDEALPLLFYLFPIKDSSLDEHEVRSVQKKKPLGIKENARKGRILKLIKEALNCISFLHAGRAVDICFHRQC